MKKISLLIAAMVMLCSMHSFAADKNTKEMLKLVANVNSSWKPIIGTNMYTIKREHDTVYIILLYTEFKHSSDGSEADPEKDDVRAIFKVKDNKCILISIDEAMGLEHIRRNIDILVP